MTQSTYFILASLRGERRHGYGIIKRAEVLSAGRIRLAAGTLYGALDRLLKDELLATDGEEVVDGRSRRYYRLTDAGEAALQHEAQLMQDAARVVLVPRRQPAS